MNRKERIPEGQIVPAECFTGCDKLASVTATYAYMIGDSAFRGCGFIFMWNGWNVIPVNEKSGSCPPI